MDEDERNDLLEKLGYFIASEGLGDMNDLELYHSWQTENTGLEHLTLEDAAIVLRAAYYELGRFQTKMSKKSKGWEALKAIRP